MSEWRKCRLGDVVKFGNGKARPTSDGIYPIYGGNGVLGYTAENNYKDETIIIGRVGAYCGATYYENRSIWVSDNALSAKPKNDNDAKFIYFLLKNMDLNQYAQGSSHPLITQTLLNSIDVEITADIKEQKAIAAVLSSLDDKIDLLHRQNKTLEAMAEALFKQWFVVEKGEDWVDTTLEQHTEVFRGLSYKGSGLTDKGLGLPMHNLNSVYEGGGYKYSGIKYYSGDFKERHLIKTGDIIVTNTEQGHDFKLIGFPAIVPNCFDEKGIFSQHIYRLITKTDSYLTKEYLYFLLMTPEVREQIISATNGSTVNMLAIDGLQRPEFKLPTENKITEFSQFVKSCWQRKEINHKQIQTLETLRDTLLPKLMSGQVRLTLP